MLGRGLRDSLTRMIVVKGVRRIGKSSLIRVGLRLHRVKLYAIFDARSVPIITSDTVYEVLARGLEEMLQRVPGFGSRLRSLLSRVDGVSLAGLEVHVTRRTPSLMLRIVEALNQVAEEAGEPMVLVFDEAQDMAAVPGFARLLAHIYDYHRRVKLVLAGSEVGLLDRLLGRGNPRAPLYGRPFLEIEMPRLSPEQSVDFLQQGFEELGLEWPRLYLEEAVSHLDGIPGWLTAYGYHAYTTGRHGEALQRVLSEGAELVREELERFLANRLQARTRYLALLECLSSSPLTWSELKTCLETKIARSLNKSQFTRYLRELRDYSFVEKHGREYRLADPLIRHALRRAKA